MEPIGGAAGAAAAVAARPHSTMTCKPAHAAATAYLGAAVTVTWTLGLLVLANCKVRSPAGRTNWTILRGARQPCEPVKSSVGTNLPSAMRSIQKPSLIDTRYLPAAGICSVTIPA